MQGMLFPILLVPWELLQRPVILLGFSFGVVCYGYYVILFYHVRTMIAASRVCMCVLTHVSRFCIASSLPSLSFDLCAVARMLSFDYMTGKTTAVSTTTVGGVARAYAFVPRAR